MRKVVDFLVIGSGVAGLIFSLRCARMGSVAVITKKSSDAANTCLAQGGIAAVVSPDDTVESHVNDTIATGRGLGKPDIIETIIRRGAQAIQELEEYGVKFSFDTDSQGHKSFSLGREGGHSAPRVVHARDYTGREVEETLLAQCRASKQIQLLEDHMAVDLLTQHHIPGYQHKPGEPVQCYGAYVLERMSGKIAPCMARIVLLATGGCGRIYLHTTNPAIATGDGIAMAYRAGADVANLEFVQFHPTSFYQPTVKDQAFLISEAVRGEGAILRLADGSAFMSAYDKRRELAPRDVVACAIDRELKKWGDPCVYLDITHRDPNFLRTRFPNIYTSLMKFGVDITKDWIPVVPAAHYMCGGVVTGPAAQTTITNLYAAGEVACTGMHGANRLASNSLLEAVVMSSLAHEDLVRRDIMATPAVFPEIPAWHHPKIFHGAEWVILAHFREEIQEIMWNFVGIVRTERRLHMASERIEIILRDVEAFYRENPITPEMVELHNMALTAALVIRSAILRKESRGLHQVLDFPDTDDVNYLHDTVLRQEEPL